MSKRVDITLRQAGFDGGCPFPVAFVRIDDELFDVYPAGTVTKRVKWLPRWLPFNSRWCHSARAQRVFVHTLRRFIDRTRTVPRGMFSKHEFVLDTARA